MVKVKVKEKAYIDVVLITSEFVNIFYHKLLIIKIKLRYIWFK